MIWIKGQRTWLLNWLAALEMASLAQPCPRHVSSSAFMLQGQAVAGIVRSLEAPLMYSFWRKHLKTPGTGKWPKKRDQTVHKNWKIASKYNVQLFSELEK